MEPWLDVTTACTFPAPWVNATARQKPPGIVKDPVDQRPLTEYVGDYGHCGFGNFSVYLEDDSLRYTFGLLLRGPLKPSEKRDTFYMTLDHPLTAENYNPVYPRGFPVSFSESDGSGGNVDKVQVTYLEATLPPVFMKARKISSSGAVETFKATSLVASLTVIVIAFSLQ